MPKPFLGYDISDRFVVSRNGGPPLYAAHSEADALVWIHQQDRIAHPRGEGYGPDGDDFKKDAEL